MGPRERTASNGLAQTGMGRRIGRCFVAHRTLHQWPVPANQSRRRAVANFAPHQERGQAGQERRHLTSQARAPGGRMSVSVIPQVLIQQPNLGTWATERLFLASSPSRHFRIDFPLWSGHEGLFSLHDSVSSRQPVSGAIPPQIIPSMATLCHGDQDEPSPAPICPAGSNNADRRQMRGSRKSLCGQSHSLACCLSVGPGPGDEIFRTLHSAVLSLCYLFLSLSFFSPFL
jgi:hypothetical protein